MKSVQFKKHNVSNFPITIIGAICFEKSIGRGVISKK